MSGIKRASVRCVFMALAAFMASLIQMGHPNVALAQLTSNRNVAVLPFVSNPADSTLAQHLYRRFMAQMRSGAFLKVMEADGIRQSLGETDVSDVLKSGHTMGEYAESTNSAFVIGGVIQREASGAVMVTIAVYGQDDSEILMMESRMYTDEASALTGIESLAKKISHPKNLTSYDTAFFYSLLMPGAGQISRGKWGHAALSVGLLSAAVMYGLSTPTPDHYVIPHGRYREEWDEAAYKWRFYVGGTEVNWIEYEIANDADRAHASRALNERRAAERRRERAVGFVIGAWIFNLIDTLLISRRNVEGKPFFDQVESAISVYPQTSQLGIGFTIRFYFWD